MLELVFVIVVIGILSAIALPRFADANHLARETKASTTLATVMTSLNTKRQQRILKGEYDAIVDLGDATYAFSLFADSSGTDGEVLDQNITNCSGSAVDCWKRTAQGVFEYHFPDASVAKFKLQNNKIVCNGTQAQCDLLMPKL